MIGKSYIIPTKAFHYFLPIISETEDELNIQVQSFGLHGELLLNERLLIDIKQQTQCQNYYFL